jgi:pimeloyl-ACP methyl ester carboxylesterase
LTATPAEEVLLPSEVPGEVQQRRVATEEGELGVVEVGPASWPGVVVAHGVGSSARFVVEAFAGPVLAAGARLIAYDLCGHGSSSPAGDPAAHTLDRHVADLAAVVASLAAPPVVLGGVSLGGHAAVRAAGRGAASEAAVLACLPAWTGRATAGEGPHAVIAAEIERSGIGAVIERLRAEPSMPSWLRDTLVTDYSRHDPASLTAALVALDGGEAPSVEELTSLDRPLAVVGWPDDPGHPLVVARRWAELASRGRLGQLRIADLSASRARLGEMAVTTLAAVAPGLLPGARTGTLPSGPLREDGFGDP